MQHRHWDTKYISFQRCCIPREKVHRWIVLLVDSLFIWKLEGSYREETCYDSEDVVKRGTHIGRRKRERERDEMRWGKLQEQNVERNFISWYSISHSSQCDFYRISDINLLVRNMELPRSDIMTSLGTFHWLHKGTVHRPRCLFQHVNSNNPVLWRNLIFRLRQLYTFCVMKDLMIFIVGQKIMSQAVCYICCK